MLIITLIIAFLQIIILVETNLKKSELFILSNLILIPSLIYYVY